MLTIFLFLIFAAIVMIVLISIVNQPETMDNICPVCGLPAERKEDEYSSFIYCDNCKQDYSTMDELNNFYSKYGGI